MGGVAFLALLISLVAVCFTPSSAHAAVSDVTNDTKHVTYVTLEEAVKAADSGDVLKLGEGNYTLYKIEALNTKGKDLTFVGSGVDKTSWRIGPETPDPKYFGTEYNGDYSFDGAGTITFENMTLRSGSADYLGFIRANNTVIDNCVVNGKTFYWGYNSAVFRNTTFNPPSGDYAMWTYSSPTMTFDNCKFNASGKVINVYTDAGKHDINVNFNNCAFISNDSKGKQALNINDSNMGSYKYVIKFTGVNSATAGRDPKTCSQLFGFGGKSTYNSGRSDVYFGDELVWTQGKMKSHSYTDGQHEDNFVDQNDYVWTQEGEDWYCTGHAKCGYCGWLIEEKVKAEVVVDPATCLEAGKTSYVANFTHKCFTPQTKSGEAIDCLGHDWGEPTYTWKQDGEDWYCTATRVCKRDASHTEVETVKATYEVTTPATTEKEGAGLYTASFKNDVFKTQTKDDVIAKLPAKEDSVKADDTKAPEAQPILATTGDVNAFAIPVVLAVAAAAAILTFVALRRKNQR